MIRCSLDGLCVILIVIEKEYRVYLSFLPWLLLYFRMSGPIHLPEKKKKDAWNKSSRPAPAVKKNSQLPEVPCRRRILICALTQFLISICQHTTQ